MEWQPAITLRLLRVCLSKPFTQSEPPTGWQILHSQSPVESGRCTCYTKTLFVPQIGYCRCWRAENLASEKWAAILQSMWFWMKLFMYEPKSIHKYKPRMSVYFFIYLSCRPSCKLIILIKPHIALFKNLCLNVLIQQFHCVKSFYPKFVAVCLIHLCWD